jgi:hypothetical protein
VNATDSEDETGSDTVTVHADIPACAIRVELTWNTADTDLDSHLIAPGFSFNNDYGDCYYLNPNPDWDDTGGPSAGDPSLDVDDTDGYGPEHIVLCAPPFNGRYSYKVYYYSDHGNGPSTATVKVYINDGVAPAFEDSMTLSTGQVWDCACIDWPSGNVYAGSCPEPTPTPTPTPMQTLTVTANGCCDIRVTGLPGGEQTVYTYQEVSYFEVPLGTTVTLEALDGDDCHFYYWNLDGGLALDNPLDVYMDDDHYVADVSFTIGPTSLTVVSNGCCPLQVSGLAGLEGYYADVPAGGNATFLCWPFLEVVTIEAVDDPGTCWMDYWTIDDGDPAYYEQTAIEVPVNEDHVVTAYCTAPPIY